MTMYKDGVQKVEGYGNSAPLKADAPKLIGTILFNELTANTTTYKNFVGVLSRNARQRTFTFQNNLNVGTAANAGMYIYDSTLGFYNGDITTIGAQGPTAQLVMTSEKNLGLCGHYDSLAVNIPIGATAPTSGNIKIYVTELI